MRDEDLLVQRKLIEAGYGARALECRGSMLEVLEQILAEDPDSDEFVDALRGLLSAADRLDGHERLAIVRQEFAGIKACPEPGCGHKPYVGDFFASDGRALIVCLEHATGAISQDGATLSEAVANWNSDDWVADAVLPRTIFPL